MSISCAVFLALLLSQTSCSPPNESPHQSESTSDYLDSLETDRSTLVQGESQQISAAMLQLFPAMPKSTVDFVTIDLEIQRPHGSKGPTLLWEYVFDFDSAMKHDNTNEDRSQSAYKWLKVVWKFLEYMMTQDQFLQEYCRSRECSSNISKEFQFVAVISEKDQDISSFHLLMQPSNCQPSSKSLPHQDVSHPLMPPLCERKDLDYRMAIGFPCDWSLDEPTRNEIWIARGPIRDAVGVCFVRMSEVNGLRLASPEEFLALIDRDRFLQMNSAFMSDIEIILFDDLELGGRFARRVAYSGTDSGTRTGSLVYQTLNADQILTVGCVSEWTDFHNLYNDFEGIISSFRFLGTD
jgi:hypothetical protein